MLNSLQIKNIAIIESLEINFEKGLNVLSGETGAGKSIIIDSLNFVLGKRADKTLISFGKDSAQVVAFFDISDCQKAKLILQDFDIESDDELMIKRTMTQDGKNTCSINGQKVTLQMLRDLTQSLVDIYGQNDTAFIMNPKTHLDVLDSFGQEKILPQKISLLKIYDEYKETQAKIKEFGSYQDLAKNLDLYSYQIKEIEEANIKDGEEEELVALRHKMNNSERYVEALSNSFEALNGYSDMNAITLISQSISELKHQAQDDKEIQELLDRLESAKIEIKDIASSLDDMVQSFEFSPQDLQNVEERLALVRTIKRKYGDTYEKVQEYLNNIKEKYDFLQNGEETLKDLEVDLVNLEEDFYHAALTLTKTRKEVAKELSSKIEKELAELGIKNAKFEAKFKEIPSSGIYFDEMEFLFSANLGQPLRELTKIISGGELSRFMLALKNTIANLDSINTMVFDEIDTGISGQIAETVAQKLYKISKDKQVLAITHLPQLASMADTNFLIEKVVEDGNTKTKVTKLENDALIDEIMRLMGGINTKEFGRPHAQEMKDYANKIKNNL